MSSDLWDEVSLDEREENRSIDILREQSALIGKKTNNYVKGTFYKTGSKLGNAVSGLDSFEKKLKSAIIDYSNCEVNLEGQEDYNINYRRELYSFEIYNEEYKFRLFLLSFSKEYPVEIIPDEGICQDINSPERIRINDNDALENTVKKIFASKKVRLIISRMINQTQGIIEQKIIEYATEHPSFTTKELAEKMKWSMANTSNRLNQLLEKDLIRVKETKREKKWEIVD